MGIGQWLILPEKISYEIKFGIIALACVLFFVGVGLLVSIVIPKRSSWGIQSPLKIEFDGDSNVRWLEERHPLFPNQKVQRKLYGISVFNDSVRDVKNVSVEIERIEQISDQTNAIISTSPYLGLKFLFKLNDKPRMTFSPGLRDRVPLISHVNAMVIGDRIKVASTQGYDIYHEKKRHRLHVKVTGNELPPVTECFTAWVNADGELTMVRG